MIDRKNPPISRRVFSLAACTWLGALAGCEVGHVEMMPKMTKSKRELVGAEACVCPDGPRPEARDGR